MACLVWAPGEPDAIAEGADEAEDRENDRAVDNLAVSRQCAYMECYVALRRYRIFGNQSKGITAGPRPRYLAVHFTLELGTLGARPRVVVHGLGVVAGVHHLRVSKGRRGSF